MIRITTHATYVERLLQINVATLAALGTMLLGMGQRDSAMTLLVLFVAVASVWLTDFTGCSRIEAVNTATRNPAAVLGLQSTKGTIETGKDADLVLLNEDWSVHATIVGGAVVYQARGN